MKRMIVPLILIAAAASLIAGERGSLERRSMSEYLNLAPDQAAAWENAERAFNATIEPLARQQRAARGELESLLASNADACTIGNQELRLFAVSKQMRAAEQSFEQATQSILTPDQKAKLSALHEQHEKREMHEMRERQHD